MFRRVSVANGCENNRKVYRYYIVNTFQVFSEFSNFLNEPQLIEKNTMHKVALWLFEKFLKIRNSFFMKICGEQLIII